MSSNAQKQRGFTIVELLIVIVVIAILAAISIVAYNGIQQRGRDSQRKSDIATIQKALELYHIDNGGYPKCTGGTYQAGQTREGCFTTDTAVTNALAPQYISVMPRDPLNTGDKRYRYTVGSKKVSDIQYAATSDDNYALGISYESQAGPYATQFGATYNYVAGSSN